MAAVGTLAAAYVGRAWIVAQAIKFELSRAGLGNAAFSISHFGPHDVIIANFSAADDAIHADEVKVAFHLSRLWAGGVDGIDISGMRVSLAYDGHDIRVGNRTLKDLRDAMRWSGTADSALPNSFRIDQGHFAIATPQGPVRGTIDFTARQKDGWLMKGEVIAHGNPMNLNAHVNATCQRASPDGCAGTGAMKLSFSNLELPDVTHAATGAAELQLDLQAGVLAITSSAPLSLQTGALAPGLTAHVPHFVLPYIASGLRVDGAEFTWTQNFKTQDAKLRLTKADVRSDRLTITGLAASAALSGLRPTAGASNNISVASATIDSFAMYNLQAKISTPAPGVFHVDSAQCDIAGGHMEVDGLTFPQIEKFSIAAQHLSTKELIAMSGAKDISADGHISGSIPIEHHGSDYDIHGGSLTADDHGLIRYDPSAPPAALASSPGGSLALKALSNFNYDKLTISLDGSILGDTEIMVAVTGRNPDVYGGYPIALNLDFSGRLVEMLQRGLAASHSPAAVVQQIGRTPAPKHTKAHPAAP